MKDFSAWANAWNDYSRSNVNYLVFVVGGTAALVVLALSLLLESNGTVLTFFCGLAVIVTLAGIWVVNFCPIWMEDSPEPAVFTTQVEKEFGVHDFSCPPDVMSVKDDGVPVFIDNFADFRLLRQHDPRGLLTDVTRQRLRDMGLVERKYRPGDVFDELTDKGRAAVEYTARTMGISLK